MHIMHSYALSHASLANALQLFAVAHVLLVGSIRWQVKHESFLLSGSHCRPEREHREKQARFLDHEALYILDSQKPVELLEKCLELLENPVELLGKSVELLENFVDLLENSVELLGNSVGLLENSVELLENPLELLENPVVELLQNPIELLQNPVELLQNPVELLQNPVELLQNPVEWLCTQYFSKEKIGCIKNCALFNA